MATIHRSFKTALKKGEIGEQIVQEYLERRGLVVYRPVTNGAHSFDMMAIRNRQNAVAIDVKAKARLNKWRATGVNQRHFEEYRAFSEHHNMPFWLFFVDEYEQRVYGNNLRVLETLYRAEKVTFPHIMHTKTGTDIRLWHLDSMVHIANLASDVCSELQKYNQRAYTYSG